MVPAGMNIVFQDWEFRRPRIRSGESKARSQRPEVRGQRSEVGSSLREKRDKPEEPDKPEKPDEREKPD